MTMQIDRKHIGMLQMLVCACLWSIAGIFIKLISWNAFVISGWRSFFAAVTVVIYMTVTKQKFRINKSVITIGICEAGLFTAFVLSNKLTTAANAIVLQFTCPVFLMIASGIIYKKKFRKLDIATAAITFIGIAMCFMDQMEGGYLIGNIVAVGAGAMMAGMYLVTGNAAPEDKMPGMLMGHIFTAIVGIPFMFFTENTFDTKSLVSIVILGVFQLGIPYILYILSTKTCPPFACSIIAAAEPLLNPIWVAIFDGEIPGMLAIAGGIVVISAVTAWCVLDGK